MFTIKFHPKYIAAFVLTIAAVYASELLNNSVFISLSIIISVTIIWTLFYSVSWNTLWKSLLTSSICIAGMLVIQFWIPLYLLVTNSDPTVINSNVFMFGLPCRVIEYAILSGIYIFRVKPIIASMGLTALAKRVTTAASIWWVYEPKPPKSLRK
jgi:cyclic lactone autoinducer peptide